MKRILRPILWIVFSIYCFALIYILFMNRPSRIYYSIPEYFKIFSNLTPFKTIAEYIQRYSNGFSSLAIMNLLGNFVLFLPMGAFLPCVCKKLDRFGKVIFCVFTMTVVVELAQGLLRVGSIDIDDVIFNTSGAMIGYGMIAIPVIKKVCKKIGLIE